MPILLVSNTRDLTTDLVVHELASSGHPFIRLNCDALREARLSFSFGGGALALAFAHKGAVVDASTIRAAYLRRPLLDGVIDVSGSDAAYQLGEWRALLEGLYSALEGRWLNEPTAMDRAEDKLRQLRLASAIGLQVPRTLVSNDRAQIAGFVGQAPAVAKPLRNGRLGRRGDEAVVFTTRLDSISEADDAAIEAAPFIVQEEVPKFADVRVTVVGNDIFAVKIASQVDEDAQVDWRRGDLVSLAHEAFELPQPAAGQCVELVKALGLRFGAIDLVLDQQDRYWFLEINPNGQWGWIQSRTGQPIAGAIARELLEIAAQ